MLSQLVLSLVFLLCFITFYRGDAFALTPEQTVVILFNKPANIVTSHVVPEDDLRSTVYDEVQSMKGFKSAGNINDILSFDQATGIRSKLHAIGRLDADTTGLLLLTNDGSLVHHVTNKNALTHKQLQGKGITKTYQALIMGHHDEETLQCFWDGVDIGKKYGGMTEPVDDLQILDHPNHKSTLVSITISEGRNRQVRRMFHAIGSGEMKLKRTHVGEHLTLEGLEEGQWRILSDQEVSDALDWEPRLLVEASVSKPSIKRKISNTSKTTKTKQQRRRRRK